MGTEGNSLVSSGLGGISTNVHTDSEPYKQTVTDPTLGNGDGTYSVSFGQVSELNDDNVLGVTWDGAQRARLSSTSGNNVVVRFQEPDGGGHFSTTSDGTITGDLEIVVYN